MLAESVAAVGLLGCAVFWSRDRSARSKLRQQGPSARWPIPSIGLDELDPVFTPGTFGPTLQTEVAFVGRGSMIVPGGTSDAEAWILSVLAKHSTRFFEFGTCTGKTAYLWSRNAPPNAQVVTLTLAPEQRDQYCAEAGDNAVDTRYARDESAFAEFLYSNTPSAHAITQLFGDSKQLDESPYQDWADLVFVDGSHARSYVESDTDKALRIVRPGGLVLWHDYAGRRHAPGVFETLNARAQRLPLRHVRGTTLVAYRRPL